MITELFILSIISVHAQSGVVPAAPAAATQDPEKLSPEELALIRDPFQMPIVFTKQSTKQVSELETIPLEQFRLVGVISGPDRVRAMLIGPGDRTFLVNEGMKIGIKDGVVKKINRNEVKVLEKSENPLGQMESVLQSIPLEARK